MKFHQFSEFVYQYAVNISYIEKKIMLLILSPAKTMDMSTVDGMPAGHRPQFFDDAEFLAAQMRRYSADDLARMLAVSTRLADINYRRYQDFDKPETAVKQAIVAYDGSVFKAMDVSSFSADDMEYADRHLRIISTLYGLLRPLDEIKAYRIAFQLKLDGTGGNLYDYWREKLTDALIADAQLSGGSIVTLCSLDVLAALDMDRLSREVGMVNVEFKEYRGGKFQVVRTYAKVARGVMARYIIKNRIDRPEELTQFTWSGFKFNEQKSDDQNFVYTRVDDK